MPAKKSEAAYLVALPNNVSDLLVCLETRDGPEVIYQSTMLKDQADECGALMLRDTAHKIQQAAVADNLDAARSLVPELSQHLQQALQSMQQLESDDS